MTSLTGSTAQTLKGTVEPPTIGKALFGGVVQISTLSMIWIKNTAAGNCVSRATFDRAQAKENQTQLLLPVTWCVDDVNFDSRSEQNVSQIRGLGTSS